MIVTALAVLLLGLGYSSWRLVTIAPMTPPLRWIVLGLWLGAFALSLVSLLLRGGLSVALTRYTYPFSTSWIFWLLYLVLLFLALDLLRLIPQLRPLLAPSWPLAGVLGLLIVGIFAWGSYRYQHKERVALELTVAKQLKRPIKIVGLSDLHLGYTIGREELSRWVQLINAERPDLILIAGDLVDGDVRPVLEDRLAELVNQLEAPVYACLGNHEYLGGEAREKGFIRQTKIQLLQDSVATFEDKLYIIGRDDATNRRRRSLRELTAGLDRTRPILLLDHQPHRLEEAEQAGIDLQLSGHTHRGQVFPINLIVDQLYERSHGYHRRGATQYYVSSGLGIWGGKYRIGTQSEYAVITLRPQSN